MTLHATDDSLLFLEAELNSDTPSCDLHGLSKHEAEHTIERFLNDQFLDEQGIVKIIHGKGDGVLQDYTERHLIAHPLVDTFHRASIGPDQGSAIYIKLHHAR